MTHPERGLTVAERIEKVTQQLPPQTKLIAVTKKISVPLIRQAYQVGIRDFGESRIQELEAKQSELKDLSDITWHFIGHLQRNKAKRAIELCTWIHSVDSLSLARRLDQLAINQTHRPKLCLQVKMLDDPSKYGWSVSELKQDLVGLLECKSLDIQGLMTILPLGLSEPQKLKAFEGINTLAQEITAQTDHALNLQELSMGMSGDFQWAIQAGATMVRVGRSLFGDR